MTDIENNENTVVVEPGDIVTINNLRYRVLEMDEQTSILIEIDTNKTNIGHFNTNTLLTYSATGEYTVEKYKEPDTVVDVNNKKYMVRNALITDIKEQFAGNIAGFLNNHTVVSAKTLMKRHHIKSLSTLLYIVRRYAQSGYDNSSLMPEKHKYPKGCDINIKSPKRDDKGRRAYVIKPSDIGQMNDAIEQYKNQKIGVTTLHLAYKYLESKYYTDIIEDPVKKKKVPRVKKHGYKPSYKQFEYYYYSTVPATERKKIKINITELRNNFRLLPGGKLEDASHPGALLEIDACEVPVDLIGTYRPEYNVGKPTLYVMRDVYSKLILAMSIGFSVNKTEALCKLFANMAADKVVFCERYGIYGLKQEMWPSYILPQKVHCDRGSDFKSKEYHRICEALQIGKGLVPGASGSMKGDVEQFFHQLQKELEHFLKDHGLIMKDYSCKHKTEAVLNMLDIAEMCILYVIYHNNHVMKHFEPSIDMEEAKIKLSPVGVWNFGVERFGGPRLIQNKTQYLDTLLLRKTANLMSSGIHFMGLIFYPNDKKELREHPDEVRELIEKMFVAQKTNKKIEIIYDPNTIEYVKYISDSGKAIKVPLNKGYRKYTNLDGYTFAMWKEYVRAREIRKREQLEEESDMESGYIDAMKGIVIDAAAFRPTKPSAKNIKQNRKLEANLDARRESVTAIHEEVDEQNNELSQLALMPPPEESSIHEEVEEQNNDLSQQALMPPPEESSIKENVEEKPRIPIGSEKYEYDPEEHYKELMRLI